MKTSGVTSSKPPESQTQSTEKTSQKSQPQREFKDVLGTGGKEEPGVLKKKGLPFTAKKVSTKKGEREGQEGKMSAARTEARTGEGPLSGAARKQTKRREDEPIEEKKTAKERPEEKPFTIPPNILMGPSVVQQKAAMEEVAPRRGLNLEEIEKIVQRVQVGVNEEGLPEFQLDLTTQNFGDLGLKISADGDQIRIQFVAEDAAAAKELEKGLQELGRVMHERGLNLTETNFTTRDQQSQGGRQDQSGGRGASEEGSVGPVATRKRRPPGGTPEDSGSGYTV